MGIDESFMLHEAVREAIGSDLPVFIFYGMTILGCVFVLRQATIPFWIALGIFGGLGAIAVLTDQLTVDGVLSIMGRQIDFEQIMEATGALFAVIAFGIRSHQSLHEILLKQFQRIPTTDMVGSLERLVPATVSTLAEIEEKALKDELLTAAP